MRMDEEKKENHRENISPGLEVDIIPKVDRTRKTIVHGIVKDILTNSPHHSYGIMVRLETREIGRVQKICSSNISLNNMCIPETKNNENSEIYFSKLVSEGENESVEYKSSALWSKNYSQEQIQKSNSRDLNRFKRDASKVIIARTIAGFLNTNGGHLIIGIKENKDLNKDEIIGIESEFGKLNDPCTDGYRRMIVDEIIRKYFHPDIYNHLSDYLKITFPKIENNTLCWLQMNKSDTKVFLKIDRKDYFFIRMDAETREIGGQEMVEYCEKHFN